MATVIGPLFSLAASGTYREEFVFRTGAGKTTVSKRPKITAERSMAQKAQTQKVLEMQAGWASLSPALKNSWSFNAQSWGRTGYTHFWGQWFAQNIVPPALPVIP